MKKTIIYLCILAAGCLAEFYVMRSLTQKAYAEGVDDGISAIMFLLQSRQHRMEPIPVPKEPDSLRGQYRL